MGRKDGRLAIAVLLITVFASALMILGSCETEMPSEPLLPSTLPSVSPSPEIIVPSGAPTIDIFGLAFSATGSLNPITCKSRLNISLMPLMYEGLFMIDEEFEAVPLLCDSFERDENSYIFYIKEGVLFSDGTELMATDVKHSLETANSSDSLYSDRLRHVASITTIGNDAVRVVLRKPIARFEQLLDIPIVKRDSANTSTPIGTGPYVYVEENQDHYLRVNSDWWKGGQRPFSRIDLIDTPEADLMINSFEAGAVSLVGNDPTATDPVVFGGDYEEWTCPTSIMYYLGFNTVSGPMRDENVRRAIGYAIDREFICETEMLRYADPATLPVNPNSRLYSEKVGEGLEFSIDRFNEFVAELGFDDVSPLEVSLIVNSENSFKLSVCERIAEDMRALGVNVNLINYKWEDFTSALNRGDFDIYLAEVKLQSDFDVTELISKDGSLNYGRYYSEEMELLLEKYLATDAENIEAPATELYERFAEDAPIAPILFKRHAVLAKRGIIDTIVPTQANIYYQLVR